MRTASSSEKQRFTSTLNQEIKKVGLSTEQAARLAGLSSPTVWRWAHGRTLPGKTSSDPALFWALVDKCGLRRLPFLPFVPLNRETKGRIRCICSNPHCGRVWWAYPSELKKKRRKVKVNWAKREARGLCARCSSRKNLKSPRRIAGFYGQHEASPYKARLMGELARKGGPVSKELLHGLIGAAPPRAKTPEEREAMGAAPRPKRSLNMLLAGFERDRRLERCRLCTLLIQRPRYHRKWVSGSWHPDCLATYIGQTRQYGRQFDQGKKRFVAPTTSFRRGGRPLKKVRFQGDLSALLSFHAHELGYGGSSLKSLASKLGTSKQNLSLRLKRLPSVLPGDWRLVFRELKPRTAETLQRLFPLPDRLTKAGDRDRLVAWLASYGMTPARIIRLTGVPPERVFELVGRRPVSPAGRPVH